MPRSRLRHSRKLLRPYVKVYRPVPPRSEFLSYRQAPGSPLVARKVRWNAASAIASTLASSRLAASTSNAQLRSLLLESLSSNLSSAACANYKVRIQAANGLMVPSDRASFMVGEAGQSALERVRQKVDAAREELKEGDKLASNKERGHFEQLVDKVSWLQLARAITALNALVR